MVSVLIEELLCVREPYRQALHRGTAPRLKPSIFGAAVMIIMNVIVITW